MARRDFGDVQLPQVSVKLVRWVVGGILLLLAAMSSVYTVQPEENAVVLRFGAFHVRIADPGLHFKLPLGIDQVIKVPVKRQLKEEFGFRTSATSSREARGAPPGDEAQMLTGDLNAANVEWVVQYRIADPEAYLFKVREVGATLRYMSEAVMRKVVGDRTVNEVLTIGRREVADEVKRELQALCNAYETGIVVDQVVLQNVTPPERVRPAFNDVNRAQQEREQKINLAEAEKNEVIPRAEGEALQMIQQAEGYAVDRVNRAEGEAKRFEALYQEYRKAPEVTRRRLYLETLNEVLAKTGRKLVLDEDARGVLPLLNLEAGGQRPPAAGGGS